MKANIRIRSWLAGLLTILGFVASGISGNSDKRVCTAVDPDCNGHLLDCSRSIPCYHGDCEGSGRCICHACWRGEHCTEYVDKYPPQFLIKSKYIALSAFDTGSLFTAEAVDADAGMTCHFDDAICPCSSVRYSIQSGNEFGLFTINSQSGHVYVTTGSHLTTGIEYTLVIRASSLLADFNVTGDIRRTHDDMTVILRVDEALSPNNTHHGTAKGLIQEDTTTDNIVDGNVVNWQEVQVAEPMLRDGENNHVRRKRTADGEKPADTTMILTLLDPSGGDSVSLGSKATYKLAILLPKITDMDLTVELFTNDPESKKSTFQICGAKVSKVGSTVTPQADINAVEPEMMQNPDSIFDRAIFNFSKVSNSDGANNDTRMIEIVFSAVLVQSSILKDKQKYYITAGAEYDSENYVWVGQSEMAATVPAGQDTASYETTFALDGTDMVNEGEAGVYTITAGNTYPLEVVTVDIFTPDDEELDLFSVGNLRLKDAGGSFACIPKDKLLYPLTYYTSESGESKYRATLDLGQVSNCASDRTDPSKPDHQMIFEFAIFIPRGIKAVVGVGNLTFATGLLIGQKTIWTAITNITVGDYNDKPTGKDPNITLISPTTAIKMPEKGTTVIRYGMVFDANSFTDTILTMTVPDTGELSLCSIRVIYRGFNIPFVPRLKYNFTQSSSAPNSSVKGIVDFGRIQTTPQLDSSNTTANSLIIEVGVRSATKASDLKLTLSVGSSKVDSPPITTEDAANYTDISMTLTDLLVTDYLFENGETGVDMEFTLPMNAVYDPFELEVMGQFGPDTVAARICRVEVTTVGRLMPCVNQSMLNENTDYTTTMDTRDFNDRAVVPFDRLCVTDNATQDMTDSDLKMVVNFVAELPKQAALKAGITYWLNAGVKMGTEHVMAGSIKYDVKAAEDGTFAAGVLPVFDAYSQDGDGPIEKGSKYVFFHFKLPPRTRASYKLTVSVDNAKMGICSLKMIHVGHNMPCVYRKIYPNNNDTAATTTITYTPTTPNADTFYKTAVLQFGSVANIGVDSLISSRRNDRNTIFIGAGIHVVDPSGTDYKVHYKFESAGKTQIEDDVTMIIGQKPTPDDFTAVPVMDTVDGTKKVYNGVTTIVYVDFEVPKYITADTNTVVFTKKSGTELLEFCSASVTFVGFNIPCFDMNQQTIQVEAEKVTVNIGKMCHTNAFKDRESSRMRVELAFNAPDGAEPTIQAEVTIAGKSQTASVALTTHPGPPPKPSKSIPFVARYVTFPSAAADLEIPVSQKKWIPVTLFIPTNATMKFNVTVEGAYEGDRAIVTLYDVMVGDAGLNVACLRNGSLLIPDLSKSDSVTMQSQNNVMKVDFGYITNTGFTDKRGTFNKFDNEVTIMFLVRMTDHPAAENKAIFALNITIQADDTVLNFVQNVTATRDCKEKEDIEFAVTPADMSKPYNKGDTFTMTVQINHSPVSSLEPTTFFLRVLTPPFLGLKTFKSNMTNVIQSKTKYIQLEVKALLFDDVLNVELVFVVDPSNVRKPGAEATLANMILRGVCNITSRTACTSYPTSFHYCTNQSVQTANVGSAGGCDNDLTSTIQDCQLSASSAQSDDTMPAKGRATGKTYWSPAFRWGKTPIYYQVDFGNTTMLMKLIIKKMADATLQPIVKFILHTSSNGRIWKKGKEYTTNYQDGTHTEDLDKDNLKTRHLRIEVTDPAYAKGAALSIAAQFQFNGCAVGGKITPEAVCADAVTTRCSTNGTQYRHFAVDDEKDVVYVCDYIPNKDKMNCFCSENQGKTWQGLPPNIGSIVGYDKVAKAMYALDKKGKSYMKSVTCKKWLPLKEASQAKSKDVTLASVVPADPPGFAEIKNGNWKANFEGVYYKEAKKIDWSICCK